MRYIITEKENINSTREGYPVDCETITECKRHATRKQCFEGTILVISQNGKDITFKNNGRWYQMP